MKKPFLYDKKEMKNKKNQKTVTLLLDFLWYNILNAGELCGEV